MPENKQPNPNLRFGVFEVNLAARELRKHGLLLRLPGQPFCILSLLLERQREVVTRQELREKLWPSDTFVDFEHGLNSAIKKLRQALGDSPRKSRYIETVPRVGYRFIAPVEEIAPAPLRVPKEPASVALDAIAIAAMPRSSRFRLSEVFLGIALALFVASGFAWWRFRTRPPAADSRVMLAVMPFENLTGEAAQDYFSDGLTEEIVSQLGRLDPQRLGVIGLRTSAMHYQRTPQELEQLVRNLGVQYVLAGSVRRDANQVRIAAKLIQARDQTQVLAREYDREVNNVLSVQSEIAKEVADEIQLTFGDTRKSLVSASARHGDPAPPSYEAYDLYLKGRYLWNKRTEAAFEQAASSFQQAIARAPNYARAYAGLADTYALMSSYYIGPPQVLIPKARAAALKALQLDDKLAEAHTTLALIDELYDWDWQTSEKEYRLAIQLDPSYATAHQWYAESLGFQGRFPEALAESERARQLDPLSLIIAADDCAIVFYSRDYDRAMQKCQAVLAMEPDFSPRAVSMVAGSLLEQGRFDEALKAAELLTPKRDAWNLSWEAFVYGRAGQAAKSRKALKGLLRATQHSNRVPLPLLLMGYSGAHDNDRVLEILQQAYAEHSNALTEIKVHPMYDPLRGDPRFQELLRHVGLAP